MARIGVAICDEAFARMNSLRERLSISQGKLYEALLTLPDQVIEQAVKDYKASVAVSRMSKTEIVNHLRKMSADDLRKLLEASSAEQKGNDRP